MRRGERGVNGRGRKELRAAAKEVVSLLDGLGGPRRDIGVQRAGAMGSRWCGWVGLGRVAAGLLRRGGGTR